jgi:hypothetical protein
MTEEQKASFDKWLEEMSCDAPPYEPRPGDQSLFAGMSAFLGRETREQKLAQPIRSFTLDWLAWELTIAGQRSFHEARSALVDAVPDGRENMLDGGDEFIVAFDVAAFALNIDPYAISLRPAELHS